MATVATKRSRTASSPGRPPAPSPQARAPAKGCNRSAGTLVPLVGAATARVCALAVAALSVEKGRQHGRQDGAFDRRRAERLLPGREPAGAGRRQGGGRAERVRRTVQSPGAAGDLLARL